MRPTDQRSDAWRRLVRVVGPPPKKPPGRVSSAIFLLVFVVWFFSTALSWRGGLSLYDLSVACVVLGSLLFGPGSAAAYHRWRGESTGGLVRLGGMALFCVGLGLLVAEMAQTGAWGAVWYSAFGLALCIVVGVAGYFYGPEDDPHPEDGPPEGRNPDN